MTFDLSEALEKTPRHSEFEEDLSTNLEIFTCLDDDSDDDITAGKLSIEQIVKTHLQRLNASEMEELKTKITKITGIASSDISFNDPQIIELVDAIEVRSVRLDP